MKRNFVDLVESLAERAGWSRPQPDAAGVCRYAFDEDVELELLSPDGRTLILRADMGAAPEYGLNFREEWEKLGRLAAGAMLLRPSVLSLRDGGRLELHRRLSLEALDDPAFQTAVEEFLNDEAWWKDELSAKSPGQAAAASPFSMGGNWFPGMKGF